MGRVSVGQGGGEPDGASHRVLSTQWAWFSQAGIVLALEKDSEETASP